jgi:hypothetical protein
MISRPAALTITVSLAILSIPISARRRWTPAERFRLDWWIYLSLGLALVETALFLIPQTRPGGLLGALCWYFGSSRLLWPGITSIVLLCGILWSTWRRPFWNRWRIAGYVVLLGLAASPLAFQTYPSSHDHEFSPLRFRLPLDGPVTVGWGGAKRDVNHHVFAPDQRWAYDLAVTKDGKSFHGKGQRPQDYYSYGLPVLAPADGIVYGMSDGAPDMPIGVLGGGKDACGNQVVLKVAPAQFLFLCHLQRGSIPVKTGHGVAAGQMLGRVGNSGNTSEPHLHIHLQDGPRLHLAEGIPLYFHAYRVGDQFVERGMPTGGIRRLVVQHVGQFSNPERHDLE